jgi:hypothetical protein
MFVLIVFFAVNYSSIGNADNGKSGPAAVSIPGYANQAACDAAAKSLRQQISDGALKSRTFTFCIPGP